jgi:hypothetical protein
LKANRAYHLIVSREGFEPAFLADEGRLDRIEVTSVDDGEVAFYWHLPPKRASRLLRSCGRIWLRWRLMTSSTSGWARTPRTCSEDLR